MGSRDFIPLGKCRFIGADLPGPPRVRPTAPELCRLVDHLDALASTESRAETVWPHSPPGAVPIFEDEAGELAAVLPTPKGSKVVRWVRGSAVALKDSPIRGGFTSREAMRDFRGSSSDPALKGITRKEVLEALLRVLDRLGLLHPKRQPGAPRSPKSGGAPGGHEQAPSGGGQSSELPGGGSPGKPEFPEFFDNPYFKPVAGFFVQMLSAAWNGGGFNTGGNLLGMMGGIASNLLLGELLNDLFPLDDESSTSEWAVGTLTPFLTQQIMFGDIGAAWNALGRVGPYESPALRVGDMDTEGNAIVEGCPSVIIEGLVAARMTDPVDKKGVACVGGVKQVLIGGLHAARVDIPTGHGTRSCDKSSPFMKGATSVFIGGPCVVLDPQNPPPPPPNVDTEKFPPKGTRGPDDELPKERGSYFDPDKGEWIMYDPAKGWSATPSEFAALPDIPQPIKDLLGWNSSWDADDPNSWSILGGLFDLGTPQWPGAGTGSTWFIPDRLFWGLADMSDYYTLHDWLFDPDNITNVWDIFTDVEIPSFLANVTWNPVQLILQIIYSGATTLASIAGWWETIWREVEIELGLRGPDGQPLTPPHHEPRT